MLSFLRPSLLGDGPKASYAVFRRCCFVEFVIFLYSRLPYMAWTEGRWLPIDIVDDIASHKARRMNPQAPQGSRTTHRSKYSQKIHFIDKSDRYSDFLQHEGPQSPWTTTIVIYPHEPEVKTINEMAAMGCVCTWRRERIPGEWLRYLLGAVSRPSSFSDEILRMPPSSSSLVYSFRDSLWFSTASRLKSEGKHD